MAENISLTAAVRTNLLSLQTTARGINQTNRRLSTGLKVNFPLDDASAFFTARALNNRGADLIALKSAIDLSISAVEAAINGIDAITELVNQALVQSSLSSCWRSLLQ